MAVELTNPVEIPATEAKILDLTWLESFTCASPCGSNRCQVRFTLRPYNAAGDIGDPVAKGVANLFEDMTEDEAQVMYSLVEMCRRRAGL